MNPFDSNKSVGFVGAVDGQTMGYIDPPPEAPQNNNNHNQNLLLLSQSVYI